jgi:hypothetical protein
LAVLFALAALACGSNDQDGDAEKYRFGAAEVEALVVGSWTGSWTVVAGSSARLALDVSRHPAQRATCGSRELNEGSGQAGPAASPQCVSTSAMQLQANLSVDGTFSNVPLSGAVEVLGFELSRAYLSLSGNEHLLTAGWSAGSWHDCRVQRPNFGELLADCTLERAP